MLLGKPRVDLGFYLEPLDEALLGGLGVDVFYNTAGGEEVDEGGAAAVDNVGAGGDEVGVVPDADVGGVFGFDEFSAGEFWGGGSHVGGGEGCSFGNWGWRGEYCARGRCDWDVAMVGFSEGAEDENQLISNNWIVAVGYLNAEPCMFTEVITYL